GREVMPAATLRPVLGEGEAIEAVGVLPRGDRLKVGGPAAGLGRAATVLDVIEGESRWDGTGQQLEYRPVGHAVLALPPDVAVAPSLVAPALPFPAAGHRVDEDLRLDPGRQVLDAVVSHFVSHRVTGASQRRPGLLAVPSQ